MYITVLSGGKEECGHVYVGVIHKINILKGYDIGLNGVQMK